MECTQCRELLSAALDGEATGPEVAAAAGHLADCAPCQAYAGEAGRLHRRARLTAAPRVPDLTEPILRRVRHDAPARRSVRALRLALVAVAAVQLVAGVVSVVGQPAGHGDHVVQHLGAVDLALAAGFALVAWRPARARTGFLPVASVLVATCMTLSVLDAARGHDETLRVVSHAAAFGGLVVAWLLHPEPPAPRERRLSLAA
jgi:predicted anti-sigma-YlaC factor YlaD